jgi:hypothetical protein
MPNELPLSCSDTPPPAAVGAPTPTDIMTAPSGGLLHADSSWGAPGVSAANVSPRAVADE